MIDVTSLILAILLAICVFTIFRFNKALKTAQKPAATQISTEISQLKSIGELSVFQVYSKEIVTKTDHAFGSFGKEYLRWLVSEKKLSMIFEFEINFIYDLTSPRKRRERGVSHQDAALQIQIFDREYEILRREKRQIYPVFAA